MSTRTATNLLGGVALSNEAVRLWGPLVVLGGVVVVAAHISMVAFLIAAAFLLVDFAYLAYRFPRPLLVVMVLAPLVDRYLARVLLPERLQSYGTWASEGLLAIVAVAILVHGMRTRRLVPALRHPLTLLVGAFVVVAVVSAVVNDVRLPVALLGTEFTVDAFALFFLGRIIGFDERMAWRCGVAFVAIAVAAGALAIGQVVLTPDLFGLTTWTGRFGEGLRPGSIFIGQPNMLAAVLAIALPFPTFAAARPDIDRRLRVMACLAALVLGIAIVFTFSRGAWVAMLVGYGIVAVLVERRAIVPTAGIAAISLAIALVLPRGVLLPPGSQWSFDLGDATFGRIDAIGQGRDQRFLFMQNAIPIVLDHPIVGTGPGTYGGGVAVHYGSPNYSRYTTGVAPVGQTVDNYWLHILVEFGLAGALLLVAVLVLPVVEILRAVRAASGRRRILLTAIATSAIVLGAASVTEMLLEGNTTSFPMWFFVGIGTLLASDVAVEDRRPSQAEAAPARPDSELATLA